MKKNVIISICISLWFSLSVVMQAQNTQIIFPRPFAVAIDDLGWNIGNNDGYADLQGPYRIGIDRKMDIDNYKCIVEVAKTLNIRLQALFIMGEMDRENILAKYPTTNPNGINWDNSSNVSDKQLEIMEFVKQNAAYLEFGLHGVLHEYWPEENNRSRAEWYNIDDNHPWPKEEIENHIACFKEILGQYGLSEKDGHSFPETFVPCAYSYYWNPEGDYSTGSILSKHGVKYANTLFQEVSELNPPAESNGGGFDHGMIVTNRINYGNEWFAYSSVPTVNIAEQESDIIESHWTNWLAPDEFLQKETNQKWVDYLNMVQTQADRYVAKNTEQFYSQWLYKKYTKVEETESGIVKIDNSKMPEIVYQNNLLGNMVLKVKLKEGEHISMANLNKKEIDAYFEDGGFGFIYLPPLEQKVYKLEYSVDKQSMPQYILNDGTFNVYNFVANKKKAIVKLRLYGKQTIKIVGVNEPIKIELSNPNLNLQNQTYNKETQILNLELKAHDIQGETTEIVIIY